MAITIVDGFDLYNGTGANTGIQTKWTVAGAAPAGGMIAGRFGGQAVRFAGGAANVLTRPLPAAAGSVAFGAAVRLTSIPTGVPTQKSHLYLRTAGGATFQCGILFDAFGAVSAYRLTGDTSGTLLGSSATGVILVNTWHYVEAEIVVSTTVGRVTVWVDGVQVLNLTGVNTANAGVGTTADTFGMGTFNGGNAPGNLDIDDLYVRDVATKLGERRVETLRPSADTAQKDWTPDTGVVNFSRVNENLADIANYVQASVVGNLDLYDCGDLSSTPSIIDAVQFSCFGLKTDATTRKIALVGDLGGTQQQTADMVLAASANKFDEIKETKPGGGAWGAADVNSLKIGPKVTV